MIDYLSLLAVLVPVAAMIAAGTLARWRNWLKAEAEESLLKLVINVLFPCLMLHSVLGNRALLQPGNVLLPPFVGFGTMVGGFGLGYLVGRAVGLKQGRGLRTFAFAVGVYNYGYIPIPIINEFFGGGTLGVLFVHNVGCDLAVWTVGVIILAGTSWRESWRRALNAPAVTIVVALTLNVLGAGDWMPARLLDGIGVLGACAVPLGLIIIGGSLFDYLRKPRDLVDRRVTIPAVVLRLGVLPCCFLLLAWWLPVSIELKRIMVVQAAMPAGVTPLVISRHFGGQPLTAAQVVLSTTAIGLFIIPWWIRWGMVWVLG